MAKQKINTLDWADVIEEVRPYIVKVMTPEGSGSGFLIAHTKSKEIVGVATAAHVVEEAHAWHQPIRIRHEGSGEEVFLTQSDRALLVNSNRDAAAVIFHKRSIPFPAEPLLLMEEGHYLKIGKEVGWMGYPALASTHLCFFSGRTSCWIQDEQSYFVDGVAINGVSGGPVFLRYPDRKTRFIGIVSAYVPNRATGAALPGLCVVRDITTFYDFIKPLASLEDAKEAAPPPPDPKQGEPGA